MIYYLRLIFSILAVMLSILAFAFAIVGNASKKLKSVLANIVIVLIVIGCMFMFSTIITDVIYSNAIQICIKTEYPDANQFNNKGAFNTFESDGIYYKWNYNAKSNTITIEGINLDFVKEIHNAI